MNENWSRLNNLRYWYFRYKDSVYYTASLIIGTLFICSILLYFAVIPQLQDWFSIRNEVIATRENITTINQNITFISSLNQGELSSELQTAMAALPMYKNFGEISQAISYATITSGASLEDYSFQIGKISDMTNHGLAQINLTLDIEGNVTSIDRFLLVLYQVLPLASITTVSGTDTTAIIDLQFLSKSSDNTSYSPEEPLAPLSKPQTDLLQELSVWQTHVITYPQQTASTEAVPLF